MFEWHGVFEFFNAKTAKPAKGARTNRECCILTQGREVNAKARGSGFNDLVLPNPQRAGAKDAAQLFEWRGFFAGRISNV
jgi:hypothetical protein